MYRLATKLLESLAKKTHTLKQVDVPIKRLRTGAKHLVVFASLLLHTQTRAVFILLHVAISALSLIRYQNVIFGFFCAFAAVLWGPKSELRL